MKNQLLPKKTLFFRAFSILLMGGLINSITTPIYAHKVHGDPGHKKSAFEEMFKKYGAAAPGMVQ